MYINGKIGRRRWMMGDCYNIEEVEEYKYLRATVEEKTLLVSRAWEI